MRGKINPKRAAEIVETVNEVIKNYNNNEEIQNKDLPHPDQVDEAFKMDRKKLHKNIGKNKQQQYTDYPKLYKKIYLAIKKQLRTKIIKN